MIRCFLITAFLILFALPVYAQGGKELPIILELFTAESCPYCPQAEALMGEYIKLDRVIGYSCPVARTRSDLHLAQDFCSRRQDYYQRVLQSNGRYTPQMIVNGVTEVVGYNQKKITASAALTLADIGEITISRATPTLFTLNMPEAPREDYMIVVARVDKDRPATGRYALGGKRIYHNMVSQFSDELRWSGSEKKIYLSMVEEENSKGLIVLAQKISTGKIVAAGQYLF